jgi:glycosyltransferase involved in cell wall biosynthesis
MEAVSVVIPVHNGAAYVADAIDSVLAQTLPPIECLVVDDGSTDATPEIVRGFGSDVRYVVRDQGGQSKARNYGSAIASGELIGFLDHDDIWLPTKLERQVEALRSQPDATLALSAVELVDAQGKTLALKRSNGRLTPESMINGMLMFDGTDTLALNSNALVRRDWLVAGGGYDPVLSISGDWDILRRTLLDGGVAYVDEPLVRYRMHGSNLHRNIAVMERDMRYAFAKAFGDPRMPAATRSVRHRAYGRLFRMLAGSYRATGSPGPMLRTLAIAVRHDPTIAFELLGRVGTRTGSRDS